MIKTVHSITITDNQQTHNTIVGHSHLLILLFIYQYHYNQYSLTCVTQHWSYNSPESHVCADSDLNSVFVLQPILAVETFHLPRRKYGPPSHLYHGNVSDQLHCNPSRLHPFFNLCFPYLDAFLNQNYKMPQNTNYLRYRSVYSSSYHTWWCLLLFCVRSFLRNWHNTLFA